jgi:hypothetical protein
MLKRIFKTILQLWVYVILALLIIWFFVAQPTLTTQPTKLTPLSVKAENLKASVYEMVEKFDGRVYDNLKVLNRTAEYIYEKFSPYATEVNYQTYTLNGLLEEDSFEYRNVIAKFKGEERCNDGLTIVGAHYDTYEGMAGANDNSSGVAGLFELARLLKENPPRCDVELVAYTLEEPPAFRTKKMGSYIHAKRLKEQGVKVKVAIVLEVIGLYSNEPNSQHYPLPLMNLYYPKEGNFIALVSNFSNIFTVRDLKSEMQSTMSLSVYSINAPEFIPGVDFSDHRNYWAFDYPSVMVTDTAFYRSNNYHTEHDTPDTLDYKRMAEVVEGVYLAIKG